MLSIVEDRAGRIEHNDRRDLLKSMTEFCRRNKRRRSLENTRRCVESLLLHYGTPLHHINVRDRRTGKFIWNCWASDDTIADWSELYEIDLLEVDTTRGAKRPVLIYRSELHG